MEEKEKMLCPYCKSSKMAYLDEIYGYVCLRCGYMGKVWLFSIRV